MTKEEVIKFLESIKDNPEVKIKIEPVNYYITSEYISSGEVEKLGISRQLLGYHVKLGNIRTMPFGKQKKYNYKDVIKIKKLEK